MKIIRICVFALLGITVLPFSTFGSTWSQTTATGFEQGQLANTVTTNSSEDVSLLKTRELTGIIASPSCEGFSGWTKNTDGCYIAERYAGTATDGTVMPTLGSYCIYAYSPSSGDVSAGKFSRCYQDVDLTEVSEIRFDSHCGYSRVTAEFRINNVAQWSKNAVGAHTNVSVDVSSYTGTHEIAAYMRVNDYIRTGGYAVFFDNFRTYRATPYFKATGTILSEEITPAALDSWGIVTFSNTVPLNTAVTVDVLDASLSVLVSNVTSGADLDALGVTNTSIKLRANLSTTNENQTPLLHEWAVSWSDDPGTSKLSFVEAASSGREDVTPTIIDVRLDPVQASTVTVMYAESGGTASNTVDYTLAGGVLTFDPGVTNIPISLSIIDDLDEEGDETVEITLFNPTNAVLLLQNVHVFTIAGDGDLDGMEDDWEILYFTNLTHDGSADSDSDRLTDLEEFNASTLPDDPDTDSDGLEDGNELYGDGTHGDNDGYVCDPILSDTDGDGFDDGIESANGRHPSNPYDTASDMDGDGLPDYGETLLGTDPTNAASPATIHVNASTGNDSTGDGSVGAPYTTVQKGIDMAANPAIVRIAAGGYSEILSAKNGVALCGAGADLTILDGTLSGKVIEFQDNSQAVVANVSIIRGQHQGGLDSTYGGSGIYCKGGSAYLCGVKFRNNVATFSKSGVAFMNVGSLRMENCEFRDNDDTDSMVQLGSTGALFLNCLFANNTGVRTIFNESSTTPTIILRNCTMVYSGGIQLVDESRGRISAYNSILWGNGDEVRGNDLTLKYSCIEDLDAGTGVIHDDPLFKNVASSNYALTSSSPCVDSGDGDEGPELDSTPVKRTDNPYVTNTGVGNPNYIDMGYIELDDADDDGLSDAWEFLWFGDLTHGPTDHDDGDSLTNIEEMDAGTNPNLADTDGDGLNDDDELNADGTNGDTDGFITSPVLADSDGDTLTDKEEVFPETDGYVTNPNEVDTDFDGCNDDVELANGTDPSDQNDLDEDTDGDGLPFYAEILMGTDPNNPDSPATIYVNGTIGSDENGGGTLSNPFATIQRAVDVARPPAIVKITAGTYFERVQAIENVALVGDGMGKTVIDAETGNSAVISGANVLVDLTAKRGIVDVHWLKAYMKGIEIREIDAPGSSSKGLELPPTFRAVGCKFVENHVWDMIYASASGETDITLLNCLIADNTKYAGTIHWCTPFKILSCTIVNNNLGSFQMYQQNSRVIMHNTIMWEGGFNGGAEIYNGSSGDPMFVCEEHHDYHLKSNSPCLDAADGFIAERIDPDGYQRWDDPATSNANIGYPRYTDIGCYESDFTDSDIDGLLDRWERKYFGSLAYGPGMDVDDDGLENSEEVSACTDPTSADTDGDNVEDGDELYGDGTHGDSDGYVTDPHEPDTDGDGIEDGEEVVAGADGYVTIPTDPDTDKDGHLDGFETSNGMNPLDNSDVDSDQDGDGLSIFGEIIIGSDPFDPNDPVKIHVNTAGNDSTGDGSVGAPYATVQKGIDMATAPAIVQVAAGTYLENITVKDKIAVVGSGDNTIIDANGSGRVVTLQSDATAALVGLKLTGGNSAISTIHASGSTILTDRTVYICDITATGNNDTSSTFYCMYGNLRISRSIFRNESADGFSYELAAYGLKDPIIVNSLFARIDQGYAVIDLDTCGDPKIINCTVYHSSGRGILYQDYGTITVANSILRTSRSGATIDLLVIYPEGSADILYCCLAQADLGGTGNIVIDPELTAPAAGNFYLLSTSPCIDAATGTWLTKLDADENERNDYLLRANTGIGNPNYGDMGFMEFGDIDLDGLADSWEQLYFGNLSRDGTGDSEGDGMTDLEEYLLNTHPNVGDSDSDGLMDGDETYGDGTHGDTDGYVTDPHNPDCDDDGILDGEEVRSGADGFVTHPKNEDTDSDGLSDYYEVINGFNPTSRGDCDLDSDGDGLSDYSEHAIGSAKANPSSPVAIHVNAATGNDTTGDGSSGNPYATILKGLSTVSTVPAMIKIAAGEYGDNLVLTNQVALVGEGSDVTSMDALGTGIAVDVPDGASVAISGLTIFNGIGNIINCPGDHDNPVDRNISFEDIVASDNDGVVAVNVAGGRFRMINSIIQDNENPNSGKYTPHSSLANLYFRKVNRASILNCLIAGGENQDNTAFGLSAAGVTFHDCPSVLMVNCTIANNEPMGFAAYNSNLKIANTIIWGNRVESMVWLTGCGYWLMPWDRTVYSRFSTINWIKCTVGDKKVNNVSHKNPDLINMSAGNYNIAFGSPAIDSGHGTIAPPKDIRGVARVNDPGKNNTGSGSPNYVDRGCYEMSDSDQDGMEDPWEIQYFGNLSHNGSGNTDNDGLSDLEEFLLGLDPTDDDMDNDGLLDGDEVFANGTHGDLDGFTSDPLDPDGDDDGLLDGEEVTAGADGFITNPFEFDTDHDGVSDLFEGNNGLNPLIKNDLDEDPDGDGLPNFAEAILGSNPTNPASPSKLYVDEVSGNDTTGDGSSVSPYASIGKAISVAGAPVSICVKAGSYSENVVLKDKLALVGDGAKITTLSSAGGGCVITCESNAVGAVVGITISGGDTNHASGIYLPGTNSARAFYVRDVIVSNNVGGGLDFDHGVIRVRDSVFQYNVPAPGVIDNGGGITCRDAEVSIVNSLSHHNERSSYTNSMLTRRGEGIALSDCKSIILNCTVAHNETYGISSEYGWMDVINSIIFWNTKNSIYTEVRNDICGHGDIYVTRSCVMNLIPGEEIEDKFEDLDHSDPKFSRDGLYGLTAFSPCTDAGNGDYAPILDYNGDARVNDPVLADFGVGTPSYTDMGYREALDSDVDGMNDNWEMQYFGNLTHDGSVDSDGDGLTDLEEFQALLNPNDVDSDKDGASDGDEMYGDGTHGDTDGFVSSPRLQDTDGDGITDGEEVTAGADGFITDPSRSDSDLDGFDDGYEVDNTMDPTTGADLDGDGDGDGLPLWGEMIMGTSDGNAGLPSSVHVNAATGNDSTGDGSSGNPYASIQVGIDSVISAPAIIKIADGIYYENLVMKDKVALVGNGSETVTVNGGNSDRVIDASGATDSVVVGMTLISGNTADDGAGFVSAGTTNSNVYLNGVNISGCSAAGNGGAIAVVNGSLRAARCQIINNGSQNGGGVYCDNVYPCIFINCVIADNISLDSGEAMYFKNCYNGVQIINCTVANNGDQGIMFHYGGGTLVNSIIWNNDENIAHIKGYSESEDIITISCIIGNDGDSSGNQPLFYGEETGDYHIVNGSTLIDAGRSIFMPGNDIDGYVRWNDPGASNIVSSVDIGAFEYADTDADSLPDFWEDNMIGDLSTAGTNDIDSDGLVNNDEYLMKSNPLNPDTDGDSQNDGDEAIAGTDLNDDQETFRIIQIGDKDDSLITSSESLLVSWQSVTGRVYSVSYCTNIVANNWQIYSSYTNIPGTGGSISFTNSSTLDRSLYYRIHVKLAE